MRFILLLLFALAWSPATAQAVESHIFETLRSWLSNEPNRDDIPGLRRLAAKGIPQAQFLLFDAYVSAPRAGAGPRVESDTLVSRTEAEAGLRAAAAQEHPEAVFWLGFMLCKHGPLRQDPAEAKTWLERALVLAPAEQRDTAKSVLGELLLFAPQSTQAERTRGAALIDDAIAAGLSLAIRYKARALSEGKGGAKDPAAARDLLEAAVKDGNVAAVAPLVEMLARGEGGPPDVSRALSMLEGDAAASDPMARAILGELYLAGKLVGPHPRKAVELMASFAERHLPTRQKLARLLVDYQVRLPNAELLFLRLREDEDVGEPEAAWTLLRLLEALHEQFRNEELIYEVIERNKRTDDRIALADAENLARWSTSAEEHGDTFAGNARQTIDLLAEKGMGAAWTAKGKLQRQGLAYPQDDVAATESLRRAAELGDLEGMVELAEAYDDGLGTPEDPALRMKWLRQAAWLGSVEARKDLVWQFKFDTFERKMTLREGVTDTVALYGDQLGYIDASEFSSLFSNSRLEDFERAEVIAAFMDGFRAAPAALEEDRLVPMLKEVPQEVKVDIEAALKASGHYTGGTEGYFRPEVREALAAWTKAMGPLPEAEIPVEKRPPAGPAGPEIPAAVLDKAIDVAFSELQAATTDAARVAGVEKLAPIARFGAPAPRWFFLRNYHQSRLVRAAVTPEEMTRYGLDLLLMADAGMEKLEIEFIFTVTKIWEEGGGQAFADGFLATLRDDDRLRAKLKLGEVLHQIPFIPGGCDMLLEGARSAGVEALPESECDNDETRDALLAWAEKAGPANVEPEARAASLEKIYEIAGAAAP